MEIVSNSLKETKRVAEGFLKDLELNLDGATIVGLKGDLGSGKTAFVKCVGEVLDIKEHITSPTFVIQKVYNLERDFKNFNKLIHIDAYRLEKGEDLIKIGWEEISKDPQNLIFIEWPEIVQDILPPNTRIINFEFINESTRKITYV